MGVGPPDAGNVGDGEAVADEEARGGLLEVGFEDGVEAAGLVDVAVDAVLDLLRGVACSLSEWGRLFHLSYRGHAHA